MILFGDRTTITLRDPVTGEMVTLDGGPSIVLTEDREVEALRRVLAEDDEPGTAPTH